MTPDIMDRLTKALSETLWADGPRPAPLREWLAEIEAWRIRHALARNQFNRTSAARELGIGRRTLYTKMEKLGITPVGSAVSLPPERASA